MTSHGIGHNNAPINFIEWALALFSSNMTSTEKAVTFCAVIAQTGKIEDLALLTDTPARSVERARYRPAREGWLHITGSLGRGMPRTYLPGFPGRTSPVEFDEHLDLKGTHGRVAFAISSVLAERAKALRESKNGNEGTAPAAPEGTQERYSPPEDGAGKRYAKPESYAPDDASPHQCVPLKGADASRARAHKESLRDSYSLREDSLPLTPSPAQAVAVIEPARVEVLAPDEEAVGHGVIANCTTIRHPAFTISLPGIEMNTVAAGMTREQIKQHCLGHALQWAAEIEAGKPPRDVVPGRIANFLSASLMGVKNRADSHGVRMRRTQAQDGTTGGQPESRFERRLRMAEAAEQRMKFEGATKP